MCAAAQQNCDVRGAYPICPASLHRRHDRLVLGDDVLREPQ
jgi:hypothetical protein